MAGTALREAGSNDRGNSLKYNRENRPVLVGVRRTGDHALLTVTDHGLGIPAADLPHVMKRGYRGRNVATVVDGSGLGLEGAQGAVMEHGAGMQLESQAGVGTTVTVRLPLHGLAVDGLSTCRRRGRPIERPRVDSVSP